MCIQSRIIEDLLSSLLVCAVIVHVHVADQVKYIPCYCFSL